MKSSKSGCFKDLARCNSNIFHHVHVIVISQQIFEVTTHTFFASFNELNHFCGNFVLHGYIKFKISSSVKF